MASNYTCRACSKALSKPSSLISQNHLVPRKMSLRIALQPQRSLSTSVPSLYHATKAFSTELQPQRKAFVERSNPPRKPSALPTRNTTGPGPINGLAKKIREKAPFMTETYVAFGATQELLKECARPGEYEIPQALEKRGEIPTDENGTHLGVGTGWWYQTLGLEPTFINWAQITFIHMYMLQVRFRMFPSTHASLWIQHLTNQAFYAAEDRLVVWHKMNSNGLRQRYLKDTFSQWRAVLLSYDEGLVKGDAMLAAALWRNLLGGREDVDFQKLAQVVGYMRREIRRLDLASDDEVAQGGWKFNGDPGQELQSVNAPSRLMEGGKA